MRAALGVALIVLTIAGCDSDDATLDTEPPIELMPATAVSTEPRTTGPSTTGPSTTGPSPTGQRTTDPATDVSNGTAVEARQPQGFTTVKLSLAGSEPCCVWLADAPDERRRGLMEVTDLGDPVGMLFVYTAEQQASFYMYNTLIPLSIAFFDGDGRFVSSTDMVPCPSADPVDCPRYSSQGPYRYALEVPRGGLDELGIRPGTRIAIGAPADKCSIT